MLNLNRNSLKIKTETLLLGDEENNGFYVVVVSVESGKKVKLYIQLPMNKEHNASEFVYSAIEDIDFDCGDIEENKELLKSLFVDKNLQEDDFYILFRDIAEQLILGNFGVV